MGDSPSPRFEVPRGRENTTRIIIMIIRALTAPSRSGRACAHFSGTDPPRFFSYLAAKPKNFSQKFRIERLNSRSVPKAPEHMGLGLDLFPVRSPVLTPPNMDSPLPLPQQSFLSTVFTNGMESLPMAIPSTSALHRIGATPLNQIDEDIYAKLEGFNFSGSIKDRAILSCVLKMFEAG